MLKYVCRDGVQAAGRLPDDKHSVASHACRCVPESAAVEAPGAALALGLAVTAIILWNTVYLERAIQALRDSGQDIDDALLPHLSPLGWEHINLTGDYIWRQHKLVERRKFRPLRMLAEAQRTFSSVS